MLSIPCRNSKLLYGISGVSGVFGDTTAVLGPRFTLEFKVACNRIFSGISGRHVLPSSAGKAEKLRMQLLQGALSRTERILGQL